MVRVHIRHSRSCRRCRHLTCVRATCATANERTLLAWLRTSAAFFSIGLAFAKIDEFEDDLVSVAFVSVGILTFAVGCIRYYQVKTVLETKDSDFQYALETAGFAG